MELDPNAMKRIVQGTLAELLGITLTHASPERVAGFMPMRPDLTQPFGFIHGGAVMTLLDTLAGIGSALNVPPAESFTTVEFKVNFLRSIREGSVTGEAAIVHLGRRTHVWQVVAHDQQGRQMALATLTQMIIERRAS
jgi:uncharacterized protein (TIGR00369 family)